MYAGSISRFTGLGSVSGTIQDAVNYGGANDPAFQSFIQMNAAAAKAIAAQTGGAQNTAVVLLQAAQCPDLAQAVYDGGLITKTLQTMISDKLTFCSAAQKVADYAQKTHTAPAINTVPVAPAVPAPAPAPTPTPYAAPSSFNWGLWLAIAAGIVAGVGGVYYYKHHKGGARRRTRSHKMI